MQPSIHVLPSPSADVYGKLGQSLKGVIPAERIDHRSLAPVGLRHRRQLYRLVPRMVVKVETEAEVQGVLAGAAATMPR